MSGPVALATRPALPIDNGECLQMCEAVMSRVGECDLFIGCAAVADYRPAQVAEQRSRRPATTTKMQLTPKKPDIIADVGRCQTNPSPSDLPPKPWMWNNTPSTNFDVSGWT